jgi:hypothetical protein
MDEWYSSGLANADRSVVGPTATPGWNKIPKKRLVWSFQRIGGSKSAGAAQRGKRVRRALDVTVRLLRPEDGKGGADETFIHGYYTSAL